MNLAGTTRTYLSTLSLLVQVTFFSSTLVVQSVELFQAPALHGVPVVVIVVVGLLSAASGSLGNYRELGHLGGQWALRCSQVLRG